MQRILSPVWSSPVFFFFQQNYTKLLVLFFGEVFITDKTQLSTRGEEENVTLCQRKTIFKCRLCSDLEKFFRVRQHESERKIRDKSPTVSRYELRSHTIPSFFSTFSAWRQQRD